MMRSDGSEAATPLPLEEEIWKDIPGYEGQYQASTLGRIRSVDRYAYSRNWKTRNLFKRKLKGQLLRPGVANKSGHLYVVLGHGKPGIPVHQLIARTFLGEPPPKKEVCHNNGVSTDNRLSNLRYDTRQANIYDTYKHGGKKSKLSVENIREIRKRLSRNERVTGIAKDFDVSICTIYRIKHGEAYRWVNCSP